MFLWSCGCGGGVFSFFEVRISITEPGPTIGHYKDFPNANDELRAGSLVFQQGEVASKGQGKEERVRRMIWLAILIQNRIDHDDFHPNSCRCGVVQLVQLECDSTWRERPNDNIDIFLAFLEKIYIHLYCILQYLRWFPLFRLWNYPSHFTKNYPKCIQKLQVP